ncbi:hypothetical protein DOTSEDRAFT_72632 [Dothistroma septosporum NZE10]|uniref:Uncharacterized protein n=1 Tax=Dothistroma septosporum (strain NZE10 / CBS 128990) TaxID=675120 RepID=M2YMT7_DOTSN|nr:hypothetical protein DOTSEDRAFT_72632 [Dothistroma septosporum NZE10]
MMRQRTPSLSKLYANEMDDDADTQRSPNSTESGHQRRRTSKASRQLSKIQRNRKAFRRALVQPTDFHRPEVQRLGLQPYFYRLYQGKSGPDYACTASCSRIATYGRSVGFAIDTFLLLVTGAASRNLALLRQAKVRYTVTITSLRARSGDNFGFATIVLLHDCRTHSPVRGNV